LTAIQPVVDDLDHLWQQKVSQAMAELLFGATCVVAFILLKTSLTPLA